MIKDILHKEELLVSLQKTTAQFFQILNGFNPETINSIPFKGSWTGAQVADHISMSNLSIAKALLLKGTAINRDPGERIQELKDIFLDLTKKFKSPDFILPIQDVYELGTVILALKISVEKIKEAGNQVDLSEMINHPVFGDITKLEILHFVLYHTQRHVQQLENIFQIISKK